MIKGKVPTTNGASRVYIVDGQPVLVHGLAALIDAQPTLCVCGSTSDQSQAIHELGQCRPHAVILGLSFNQTSGLDLIQQIHQHHRQLPMLVVASYDETVFAERVLRAGASGYVMTSASTQTLLTALHQVLRGEPFVSKRITTQLLQRMMNGNGHDCPLARLSDREIEVYEMIGHGHSMRDIARALRRSVKTVQAHREHIKLKLGVDSARDLTRHAAQWLIATHMHTPAAGPLTGA